MKLKIVALVVAVAAWVATVAVQAENDPAQLVRFKPGAISFTLLQADGETPLNAAKLELLAPKGSRALAEAVSDPQGLAVVTLATGQYRLNVSGRTLSVLEVADDATLTTCRVVVPEDNRKAGAVLVGGTAATTMLTPVLIGGGLVLAAAGGYAIYDNNQDDDDDNPNDSTGNPTDDAVPPPPPVKDRPRPTPSNL